MYLNPWNGCPGHPYRDSWPASQDTVGLILERSSMTLQGLQIHPGVIDQDYTGEIKILTQAPQTFVAIAPTNRIAQLVFLII
jgi:dUTPase